MLGAFLAIFSAAQTMGGLTMLRGALIAPRQVPHSLPAAPLRRSPRKAEGLLFAQFAALAYGTSPIMTRMALKSVGPTGAITGGLIAYGAATVAVVSLLAFSATLRRHIMLLRRDNIPWFVYCGVIVAMAQGLLYSAVSQQATFPTQPWTLRQNTRVRRGRTRARKTSYPNRNLGRPFLGGRCRRM
jgi:hypothetical protein